MATATVTPEVVEGPVTATKAVVLTDQAIAKVKEIMATQDPIPAGLRIGVVGGGCSGFQYSMSFENQSGMMDKVLRFEDLKVFVDATSAMYLNGCVVDYVETLEAAGVQVRESYGKEYLWVWIQLQRLAGIAVRTTLAAASLRVFRLSLASVRA